MSRSELAQLVGSPTKIKKVNVMPVDGRSVEQDHKLSFTGGSGAGRIDLRLPKSKGFEREDFATPSHYEPMLVEDIDSRKGGFSSARPTQKNRDYESESTYETNRSIAHEYFQHNKSIDPTKVSFLNSAETSVQTNFKLIKKFAGSDEKGSPKYILEMKPVSPRKGSEQQISNQPLVSNRPLLPQNTVPRPNPLPPSSATSQFGDFRKVFMPKKKEMVFLPPPEYFKKKKVMKQLNYGQWRAMSVLKLLPGKPEVKEDPKFEELDDFTSLLTKRLFENLDEVEAGHGSYTVKEGSYCLIIQQEKPDKKKEDLLARDVDRKVKHFEEMLPGPCFGLTKLENGKPGTFNKEEILRFETLYKDILYDTRIRVGRFYQAFIPDNKPTKAFLKTRVIFGLPPKSTHKIEPPKITIESRQRGKRDREKVQPVAAPEPMVQEEINQAQLDKSKTVNHSYFKHDDFVGNLILENIYVPIRSINDYLEWDPELAVDSEIDDMISQVLEEFKSDPRINREVILDYLKICRLNKDRFLDHLEMDHDDFRKYLYMIIHKNG